MTCPHFHQIRNTASLQIWITLHQTGVKFFLAGSVRELGIISNTVLVILGEQQFILAGCVQGDAEEEAWVVTSNKKEPISTLKSDAEEADTRIWLHVLRSRGTKKLVCSHDTDVFHIGLPLSILQCI